MVIVIDPQIAGISGDMILSSLVNLGADKNKIIDSLFLHLPKNNLVLLFFLRLTLVLFLLISYYNKRRG